MIPVYVINLLHEDKRWKNVEIELKKTGILNYNRIDGVYGKNLSKKDIKIATTSFCKNFCTLSSIGCALSHIKTWKEIEKRNDDLALILEDDVVFESDFKIELKKKLIKVPKDFDILYVGCAVGCVSKNKFDFRTLFFNKKDYKKVNNDIYVPRVPLALHGYIVSRSGVKKLLKMIKKINGHIDIEILNKRDNLNIYASDPLLIYQNVSTDTSSNVSSTYPIIMNRLLENIQDTHRIPYSYVLSIPMYEICFIPINGYNIILLLLGIMIDKKILMYIFMYYNIFEIIMRPSNYKDVIKSGIVLYFGILTRLLVFKH
jgi:GR25 family glycosyltransferase involved in LPS biosynthesis